MKGRFSENLSRLGVKAGDLVTVALSGGVDSVVLLALLSEQDLRLRAVHVHHGLRGKSADEDAAFCASLCARLQIPFQLLKGDAKAYAKERGMSIEEGARAMRYELLASFEAESFLATAHHGDDDAETFFINLYRGSGSAGLSGIPEKRGNLIRPLLPFYRQEIEAFAKEQGLDYCLDETNGDESFLRNFLRKEILPRLNSRKEGNFRKGIAASMKHLREEEEALQAWAKSVQTDQKDALSALPPAILKRVLDRMNGEALPRLHFEKIRALLQREESCGRWQISRHRYFAVEYGRCRFCEEEEWEEIPIRLGEAVCREGKKFQISFSDVHREFTKFAIDCDKIAKDLVFRHRREGDCFSPVGRGGSSRLQKRLKNDRIPRSRRDSLWILAEQSGRVLWVEKYGADASAACDENTKAVYLVEIKEEGK